MEAWEGRKIKTMTRGGTTSKRQGYGFERRGFCHVGFRECQPQDVSSNRRLILEDVLYLRIVAVDESLGWASLGVK